MNPSRSELKAQLEKRRDDLADNFFGVKSLGNDKFSSSSDANLIQNRNHREYYLEGHDALLETVLDLYEVAMFYGDADRVYFVTDGNNMAEISDGPDVARAAIQKLIGSVKV